jgi:hypothetical protein
MTDETTDWDSLLESEVSCDMCDELIVDCVCHEDELKIGADYDKHALDESELEK